MWPESWATREPGEAVWSRHPRLWAEARDSALAAAGSGQSSVRRGCLVFPTHQL